MSGLRVIVEADGGSRGNPGPAGYGAVVRDASDGQVLLERSESIGRRTNNVAEYRALIAGLQGAAEVSATEVDVRMDSKLVVEQMSGRWKVKHPDLQPLAREAAALVRSFDSVSFRWVPRERNKAADQLANEAMDAAAGKPPTARESTVDKPEQATLQLPTGTTAGWSAPTGTPTTTILVRHGTTERSAQRRFSGRVDLPLTEVGEAQAKAAAARLARGPRVDAVLSSPLRRAADTAGVVADALGLQVRTDDGLVECDFGAWEGLTFAEIRERWPADMESWLASPDVAPPDGESFTAVAHRVRRARDRLLAAHPGGTVVVVSHVTPIKTLVRMALEAPATVLYRLHLDLASLSTVDWYADGLASLRLFNDTSHLEG